MAIEYRDPWSVEVCAEIAGRFFGMRKSLETRIEGLRAAARGFAEGAPDVAGRAGILRFLVGSDAGMVQLLEAVGHAPQPPFWPPDGPAALLPPRISPALRTVNRWAPMVRWAYTQLQAAADLYMDGPPAAPGRLEADPALSYRLIEKMCELINGDIAAANEELLAGHTLDYVRRLQALHGCEPALLGGGPGMEAERMGQRLAFPPVRFAELGLIRWPQLPPLKPVERAVARFCARWYAAHPRRIQEVLTACRERRRRVSATERRRP